MRHSSSRRGPVPFRGFGLCVAAVLAGYISLIGALGMGIKHTLDAGEHPASVASASASSPISVSGAVIRANVSSDD